MLVAVEGGRKGGRERERGREGDREREGGREDRVEDGPTVCIKTNKQIGDIYV